MDVKSLIGVNSLQGTHTSVVSPACQCQALLREMAKPEAGERALQLKALDARPDSLSLNPSTHLAEGED